jgi:hypothetical protein
MFKRALLGKWLWCYAQEREAWQRMVLKAKCDLIWGGWCSNNTSRSHGVGLWKYIIREWLVFFRHTRLDPRDWSKIRFWEDIWCEEVTLKDTFPGLYNIASAKEASIEDNMDRLTSSLQRNVSFIRMVPDWEV